MTLPRSQSSALARALGFGLPPGTLRDPHFEHVLELLPGAAALVFQRTRTILAANGRAVALTEWSRPELVATTLTSLLLPSANPALLEASDHLQPGSVRHFAAAQLRTRSGGLVPVDVRLSAFGENGETVVLVLATPAAERLGREREASRHLRALETIDQLLTLLASPTEGSLEWAMPLIREMLQADAAGLYRVLPDRPGLRLQCADGVPVSFGGELGAAEANYLVTPMKWASSQRADAALLRSVRAAGWTTFMAHPVGDPPGTLGTLFVAYRPGRAPSADAAEMLAIAARLMRHLMVEIGRQASHFNAQSLAVRLSSRLAAISGQMDQGVVALNHEGTIDDLNGAAQQMLGFRAEDIIGLPFEDVLIADGPLLESIRGQLSGAAGLSEQVEDRLRRRSGEPFPVTARLQPLPDGGAVLLLRDMSEARASELRREHLDHLAYVGQSTESFAHEVRAPLNNISMGVQYLASRLPPDEELALAFGRIQVECARLSDLMKDMLAWAKPVVPQFEPLDLAALLRRLLHRWNTKIQQRNVRLHFMPDDCPRVYADARLLERVFVNLIENALQAMPAGGELSISMRTLNVGARGLQIEARVSDSGPGIPEDVRRRIFDPYFTTKADGTGLGLAICKRLVTIHRGAISVESFPLAGTIFSVTLPAYDPSQAAAAAAQEATP